MTENTGFSAAEREAMKQRAEELRREKGGKKKARNLEALQELIQNMPEDDKALAAEVHGIVTQEAPHLDARTWYGMPAYESDQGVVIYLQVASKFGVRYSTLGFNDSAQLDEGTMWPTAFAITTLDDVVRDRIHTLVRQAAPAPAPAPEN